ncbi:ATP-binding protein [Kineococcus aurantiacus]|nr:ATP-binding protein [Kineococcus aurantiacus]
MTPPARAELPLDLRAVRAARRFLGEQLCTAHHSRVEDEAELLVSELIGNGLRHGLPPVVLTVECDGRAGLRVSVRDHDPTPPVRRETGPEDESGRGMGLVDLVSDEWGVETSPRSKSVWFRLNRSAPAV